MSGPWFAKFKAAPLGSPAEVEALMLEAGVLDSATLLKVVDLMIGRSAAEDFALMRRRALLLPRMFAQTQDPALFVPLLKALKGAEAPVRDALVEIIPKVNNPAEHTRLCQLLDTPDQPTRAVAARMIAQIGGKTALAFLNDALGNKNFQGRMEADPKWVAQLEGGYGFVEIAERVLAARRAQA